MSSKEAEPQPEFNNSPEKGQPTRPLEDLASTQQVPTPDSGEAKIHEWVERMQASPPTEEAEIPDSFRSPQGAEGQTRSNVPGSDESLFPEPEEDPVEQLDAEVEEMIRQAAMGDPEKEKKLIEDAKRSRELRGFFKNPSRANTLSIASPDLSRLIPLTAEPK